MSPDSWFLEFVSDTDVPSIHMQVQLLTYSPALFWLEQKSYGPAVQALFLFIGLNVGADCQSCDLCRMNPAWATAESASKGNNTLVSY